MKILFLHLTDLHLKNKSDLDFFKIHKITDAINSIESFDEAVIVFSGDIAMSGQKQEYEGVKKLFDILFRYFRNKIRSDYHVNVMLVPGNHDIAYIKKEVSRVELISGDKEEKINIFINMMNNFFNFATVHKCFIRNKIVDVRFLNFSNFVIRFNLLNTAPLSTLNDQNGDYDYGIHYIPEQELNVLLQNEKGNFEITVMHHSTNFYEENSKYRLNDYLLRNTDIIFYGHEHVYSDEVVSTNELKCKKILGAPLSSNGSSSFGCVILDTENLNCNSYKFQWNPTQRIYECSNSIILNSNLENFSLQNKTFIDELKTDNIINDIDDFRKIYEFPELSFVDDSEDTTKKNITEFNGFNKAIKDKSMCFIEGTDECGKTTLAKYLFLKYSKNCYPVLFNSENIKNERILSVVRTVFKKQYNTNIFNYSKFEQENFDKKIAIVDDVDKIEKQQLDLMIEEIKKKFGKVILISGKRSDFDSFEISKKHLLEEQKLIRFKITEMYTIKRKKILYNVFKYYKPYASEKEISNIVNKTNEMILKEFTVFHLTPSFIILYAKTAFDNKFEMGSTQVFNTVFQSNITKMIQESNDLNPSSTLILLQKIAYYIHINKKYPLPLTEFITIVNLYNESSKGLRDKINPSVFLNSLIKVRLLKYADDSGSIIFCYNSYLSFFIAREILKLNDICASTKLVENICYGINADILLFLCYLNEGKQELLIDLILKKSELFFDKIGEFNFIDNEYKCISKKQKIISLSIPNKSNKENFEKQRDKSERIKHNNDKLSVKEIYDYDEESIKDITTQLQMAKKYIEIISKILPDFIHNIDTSYILMLIKGIYTYPNKYLHMLFSQVDVYLNDYLSGAKNFEFSENTHFLNESEEFKKFLNIIQRLCLLSILDIYSLVAKYSSSSSTHKAIESFEYRDNICYQLINCMYYDYMGQTEELGKRLSIIYDNFEDGTIQNLCKLVFYNHCINTNNQINYVGKVQSYLDKFFNTSKTLEYNGNKKLINKFRVGNK